MKPSHELTRGERQNRRPLPRHTCRACEARPARFQYRGQVRADRQHELCFRCFRAAANRMRAWALAEAA
jgi:hypothetical protein